MSEPIPAALQAAVPAPTAPIATQGFLYVSEAEAGNLHGASVGATVRNATAGPPWIVVDHVLPAVRVGRWPGRLLRVGILEKAAQQPMAGASYTRAIAVIVLEELPAHVLLGEYGAALAAILRRIVTLTHADALALSAALPASARHIYSTAWNTWLARVDGQSIHRNGNHENTLQIQVGHAVSPVGYALSLVSSMVLSRAQLLSGAAAIVVDAEGEVTLQPPWSGAGMALRYAAMACGAPGLLTRQDAQVLACSWESLMGKAGGA